MRMTRILLPLLLMLLLAGCQATATQQQRATELRPGQLYYGQMSGGSQLFTFTLAHPSNVLLEASTPPSRGLPAGFNGRLIDANGQTVIEDNESGENRNFRIETTLAAGTWYLEVRQPFSCRSTRCESADMSYTLNYRALRN
ncbi:MULTISPECIES: hypothetical protein [Halomonadaceae]|uniref:hypothetical protein n=1 Tax=Halomonadaceae TaxID=28256 RepID=UPI00159A1C57|nr:MULTISPECIES: hypothetical protein [Halomonas]QJQ96898.1 hypothetical protein HIO72_17495 [Halomonas sp. PA5]